MSRVQTAASADLDQRLARMFAAAPAGIGVNSEVRDQKRQQQLWDAALKKYGSAAEARKWVAPPGRSQHELGHAADLSFSTPAARQWAHDNAARFGLAFPLGNEPWHVELAEARKGGTVTGQSSTGPVPVGSMSNQQVIDYVESHYGYASVFLHDKELGPILIDAAKRGLGADELKGKLSATKWWKTHTDAEIKWTNLNANNPAEAKNQVNQKVADLQVLARSYGVVLTGLQLHDFAVNAIKYGYSPQQVENGMRAQGKADGRSSTERGWDQEGHDDRATQHSKVVEGMASVGARAKQLGVTMGGLALHDLTVNALRSGWSQKQIDDALVGTGGKNLDFKGDGKTPTAAMTSVGGLKQLAAQYMVPVSDLTLQSWVSRISTGQLGKEEFDTYLKDQAKILRPWMAKQIDAGITPSQYADPYRQTASQLLEMPGDSIDLMNNPKFSVALDNMDPATGVRGPMSLTQWQTYLRGTDEYKKTGQANEQAASFATTLTKTFGKLA